MGKPNVPNRRPAKVLIVDDDADSTIVTLELLKAERFRPSYVCNGLEALRWIEEHGHPDVILLDINMPVMNGKEFMEAYFGPAAIIVTTAESMVELPRRPIETLYKPYRVDDLIGCIEYAVECNGGPLWVRLLPCTHTCIGVGFEGDKLVLCCMIPGCEKRTQVRAGAVDIATLIELRHALVQAESERKQNENHS